MPSLRAAIPGFLLAPLLMGGRPATEDSSPLAPDTSEHAEARLVAETPVLLPGETQLLGIHLDVEEGWHVYWKGLNDTGYPVSLKPILPEGFTTGEVLWPAPSRHLSPGNILDHVYAEDVTFLIPLNVPSDLKPGSHVTLRYGVQWLACKEICIPGADTVSIVLPVREEPAPPTPSIQDLFEAARARIPIPLAEEDRRVAWSDRTLGLTVPGADALSFYPSARCTPLSHPIEDAVSKTDRLSIRFQVTTAPETLVQGVLEVRKGSETKFYTFETPLAGGS